MDGLTQQLQAVCKSSNVKSAYKAVNDVMKVTKTCFFGRGGCQPLDAHCCFNPGTAKMPSSKHDVFYGNWKAHNYVFQSFLFFEQKMLLYYQSLYLCDFILKYLYSLDMQMDALVKQILSHKPPPMQIVFSISFAFVSNCKPSKMLR